MSWQRGGGGESNSDEVTKKTILTYIWWKCKISSDSSRYQKVEEIQGW